MKSRSFIRIFSLTFFRRLFKLLLTLTVLIQCILILYNHFYGIHVLNSLIDFFSLLIVRVMLGIFASILVAYPYIFLIKYLNKVAPWSKLIFKRIVIQLSVTIVVSTLVSVLVTYIVKLSLREDTIDFNYFVSNALTYSVANIILVIILEAWMFFEESRQAVRETEKLKHELLKTNFEILKGQINPHFMFNSLNVLSGLINTDTEKAHLFINEFSQIYRYVLETIELPLISISREIAFIQLYLHLQQIRYGNSLSYHIDIDPSIMELSIPPMSLQALVENAIKHNIVNSDSPLHIKVYSRDMKLFVSNAINPKVSLIKSTGVGLKNLSQRYMLVSELTPQILIEDNYFIVALPVLDSKNNTI